MLLKVDPPNPGLILHPPCCGPTSGHIFLTNLLFGSDSVLSGDSVKRPKNSKDSSGHNSGWVYFRIRLIAPNDWKIFISPNCGIIPPNRCQRVLVKHQSGHQGDGDKADHFVIKIYSVSAEALINRGFQGNPNLQGTWDKIPEELVITQSLNVSFMFTSHASFVEHQKETEKHDKTLTRQPKIYTEETDKKGGKAEATLILECKGEEELTPLVVRRTTVYKYLDLIEEQWGDFKTLDLRLQKVEKGFERVNILHKETNDMINAIRKDTEDFNSYLEKIEEARLEFQSSSD